MYSCQECGSLVTRKHREGTERLLYKARFFCKKCGADTLKYRAMFQFLQRHVDCPLCGTVDVTRLGKVDRIDRMSKNPFRKLLRLIGARLYHCGYCRYQFYDTRPPFRAGRRHSSKHSGEDVALASASQ